MGGEPRALGEFSFGQWVDSAVQRGKQLVGRELTENERIEFGVPNSGE